MVFSVDLQGFTEHTRNNVVVQRFPSEGQGKNNLNKKDNHCGYTSVSASESKKIHAVPSLQRSHLSRLLSKFSMSVLVLLEFSMLEFLLFRFPMLRSPIARYSVPPFPFPLLVTVGNETNLEKKRLQQPNSAFPPCQYSECPPHHTFWCWRYPCSPLSSAPGPTPHHLHGSCIWKQRKSR